MTAITEDDRGPHDPLTVLPDVHVVPLRTPTLPPATHTNCVVVGDGERCVVIDPASPFGEEQERLHRWLSERGAAVEAIWLTHHHPDHVGGADDLRRRTGAKVHAHPATAASLGAMLSVDEELYEGDRFAFDGGELVALHTPGHARGHLAFRHEPSRLVVAGDLVAGQGTIVIDPPEGDMADYLATLGRLMVEDTRALVPAHGPVIDDAEAKLLEYIAHRKQREEQIVEALRGAGALLPLEIVPACYPDVPAIFHPLAARQVLAHLLKLEQEGRVRRPDGSEGVPGAPVYMAWGGGGRPDARFEVI